MGRPWLVPVVLAACSDPAAMPDAGVDAPPDAGLVFDIAPASFDFGNVDLADFDRPTQTFTITNVSPAAVELAGITIGGANVADFTLGTTTCAAMLEVGASCTVSVQFTPTARDLRNALLEVRTAEHVAAADLQGNATLASPRLIFDPPAHTFGDVGVGEWREVVFTVLNEVADGAYTASIAPDVSGLTVTMNTCANTIPLHGTCDVAVAWTPPYSGEFLADVKLTAGSDSWGVGVHGLAARPLMITGSGAMGTMLVGQPEATLERTFTIMNTKSTALGDSTSGDLAFSFTGAGADAYEVASTTCTSLGETQACDVVVRLDPTTTTRGPKAAQLVVSGETATYDARATLSGSVYSVLIVPPASGQTYTVINASSRATSTLTVTATGGYSVMATTCEAGIAANGACTVTVQGSGTGTLSVSGAIGGADTIAL